MSVLELAQQDQLWTLDGLLWSLEEGQRLAYMASRVPRHLAIIEIGSHKGKSTCFLAAGSRAGNGARVYAVDLWDLADFIKPSVLEDFRAQVNGAGLEHLITPVRGDSLEVAARWKHRAGLLFIDGCHEYEAVRADYRAWGHLVEPGGYVAFHDYHEQFPGVVRVVDEIVRPSEMWGGFCLHGESLVSLMRDQPR